MNDVPRFSEALEGYAALASELLATWTPFVSSVSARIGDGTYSSDDAATDFPMLAKLTTDSAIRIGSEGFDALSVLTSDFSEVHRIEVSTGETDAPTERTLTVQGDFVSFTGLTLSKSRIKVVPRTLAPQETDFTLVVDARGLKARTYDGVVVGTDPSGATHEFRESVTIG